MDGIFLIFAHHALSPTFLHHPNRRSQGKYNLILTKPACCMGVMAACKPTSGLHAVDLQMVWCCTKIMPHAFSFMDEMDATCVSNGF